MATLHLKPTDTIVKDYYKELSQFDLIGGKARGSCPIGVPVPAPWLCTTI